MATIREIAERAGVSKATVSNVLNGRHERVSPETLERVLRSVRDEGYKPGAAVVRGKQRLVRNLGIVMLNLNRSPILGNGYFASVLDGIIGTAAFRHWSTTLYFAAGWQEVHRELRELCDGRVDGMIVVAETADRPISDALFQRGTPFVLVSSGSDLPSIPTVDVDNRAGLRLAVRHLVELGHRRIGHASGGTKSRSARERTEGFLSAVGEAGLDSGHCPVFEGGFLFQNGREAGRQILEMEPKLRPTAVTCANDVVASGVMSVCYEQGVIVPEEMSIVGFDDTTPTEPTPVPLTTIHHPIHAIATHATQSLLDFLEGQSAEIPSRIFPPSLVVRATTSYARPTKP
jgi:LacI family transcriptional regulator